MSKIGWAYGLKTIPKEIIEARKRRTGCLSAETADADVQADRKACKSAK